MDHRPYFVHVRRMKSDGNGGKRQDSRWAATVALNLCNEDVVAGVSLCSPKDNFNRKRGREIATGRLASADVIVFENAANKVESHEDYESLARDAIGAFVYKNIQDAKDAEAVVADLELYRA